MAKRKAEDEHGGGKRFRSKVGVVSGPGIFMTCLRGKERKAMHELIDFLEDIADRIYPDVVLHDCDAALLDRTLDANDDDDLDALMNGGSTTASTAPTASTSAAKPKGDDELDIEAQIRAELEELQPRKKDDADGGRTAARPSQPLRRFVGVDTGAECFCFISCTRPLDPAVLVGALLEEVERTGESRGRFAQRLTPVMDTCSANMDDLVALAARVLPVHFPSGEGVAQTYKVEPRIRSHNVMHRDGVIQSVANAVPKDGGHRVDLKDPNARLIIVEVFRNVAAIAVVRDYDRFRKYNPLELAKSVQERVAAGAATSTHQAAAPSADGAPAAPAEKDDGPASPNEDTVARAGPSAELT